MSKSIYSVKSLLSELRAAVEGRYQDIWVEGEISNLAKPPSGHMYFALKEGGVVVRCAFFGAMLRKFSSPPADGMQVLVRGRISIYEARGDLQLIIDYLEEAGEGARRRELEQLKRKLQTEGLFAETHKKELPSRPHSIGLITSPSGAVVHDIRVTLARRYPLAKLIVYPVLVQGEAAAETIVDMLKVAEQRREVDILIIARGGGSLEDLQAFNDEGVARQIFKCKLPVVSAIGHETDFTIADMVADVRAPTPTAAAEIVAPDLQQILNQSRESAHTLQHLMKRYLENQMQYLDYLNARMVHPLQRVELLQQKNQSLRSAIIYSMHSYLQKQRFNIQQKNNLLQQNSPRANLSKRATQLQSAHRRLHAAVVIQLTNHKQSIAKFETALDLMNPRHTLARGYAILQDEREHIIIAAAQTKLGQRIKAQVANGEFQCIVDSK